MNTPYGTNGKYGTAATLYTLEPRFFSYKIVNTQHKGDDKDNTVIIICTVTSNNILLS